MPKTDDNEVSTTKSTICTTYTNVNFSSPSNYSQYIPNSLFYLNMSWLSTLIKLDNFTSIACKVSTYIERISF